MALLLLRIFSIFFIVASLIPFIKWDHWWIRVFDYPRLQKLVLILVLLLLWAFIPHKSSQIELWVFIFALSAAALHLILQVIPFSPFGEKMIKTVEFDSASSIHVLVSNVYQTNTHYHKLVNLIQENNPDLIFLVETDSHWENGLKALEEDYKFLLKLPKDNTYGLLLYSKLEILSHEIHYLVSEEIPSVELDVKLKNGEVIKIYGIHPEPPFPTQNTKSTDRDAEILIVGKKVKQYGKPALVIGDLNDVAWSSSTELFLKISEMADPRRGRGVFNTFHAKIPFFKWPLDHVFLSKQFGLVSLQVQDAIGSDHFPISMVAQLTETNTSETIEADGEEKEEARETIDRGLKKGD